MYERVNPAHPDKVADRIAGAIVDLAYAKQDNPKCAVEVLIGHGKCHIINETSCHISKKEIKNIVKRIAKEKVKVDYLEVKQDFHLAKNQSEEIRCGDNGIFKGCPITKEQEVLTQNVKNAYSNFFPTDGKFIINGKSSLIVCQSNAKEEDLKRVFPKATIINPLGHWTGGINVDSGATNRKLGSDMGEAVTGGGLHGKDLSKADVSVNIYAHLRAQKEKRVVLCYCAIGDTTVKVKVGQNKEKVPYSKIVSTARKYIKNVGGFEKFAEWGLI